MNELLDEYTYKEIGKDPTKKITKVVRDTIKNLSISNEIQNKRVLPRAIRQLLWIFDLTCIIFTTERRHWIRKKCALLRHISCITETTTSRRTEQRWKTLYHRYANLFMEAFQEGAVEFTMKEKQNWNLFFLDEKKENRGKLQHKVFR